MEGPLILVIDDSPTIRKLVECHLSQAGYKVAVAADADAGVAQAAGLRPALILLDHQLPGTTGDEVCRRLLDDEATSKIPVVISSAMRNRAFARYAEFANVVDQIPKPFTPELLKSGVANALQVGAMVVQAQRTGSAIPEAVGEVHDAALEGDSAVFPVRAVLDFLNNNQQAGRLTLEQGKDRIKFVVGGGRIQAVFAPTMGPDRIDGDLPADLADLAPLLAMTLGEHQDASMAGLVKMLERSLSDPRRLRALLRSQAAILLVRALTGEPGRFAFEPRGASPPMFQAFPLQASLPALAVEGVRRCEPIVDPAAWASLVFARQAAKGGNLDRAGLAPGDLRILSLCDGTRALAGVAEGAGVAPAEAAAVARGLELAGLLERRSATAGASVLLLDDDPETARTVQATLGDNGHQVKAVRDRVGAQLLLRRNRFDLILLALDRPEHDAFFRACKEQVPASTRFVGIAGIEDESELSRLDAMGLDGVLHRPVTEADLKATVDHLLRVA
ncbi:MAG TPA: response regulator [Isosphaeraceae bacterium]|jgi:CheY-like chemotaxis protein|nr:response regulator [Isosphaeraceae bacterium]